MINRCSSSSVVDAEYFYQSVSKEGRTLTSAYSDKHTMISTAYVPLSAIKPRRSVRVIATIPNVAVILSAGKKYNVPVEYCSPLLMEHLPISEGQGLSYRVLADMVHLLSCGMPSWDFRNFRIATKADMYQFGLCFHVCADRLQSYAFNIDEYDDSILNNIDTQYTGFDRICENHVMGSFFSSNSTLPVDLCAGILDPRMCLTFDGKLAYHEVGRLFGFSTTEVGVRIARMFVDMYGDTKLPYDHVELREQYYKLSGVDPSTFSMSPPQLLGLRVFHRILVSSPSDLAIVLGDIHGGQLAHDVDKIQRYLHKFLNVWLTRLNVDWVLDDYSADLYESPSKEEEDGEDDYGYIDDDVDEIEGI